jgi:hypothetical protein
MAPLDVWAVRSAAVMLANRISNNQGKGLLAPLTIFCLQSAARELRTGRALLRRKHLHHEAGLLWMHRESLRFTHSCEKTLPPLRLRCQGIERSAAYRKGSEQLLAQLTDLVPITYRFQSLAVAPHIHSPGVDARRISPNARGHSRLPIKALHARIAPWIYQDVPIEWLNLGVSWMDFRNYQTATASRQSQELPLD